MVGLGQAARRDEVLTPVELGPGPGEGHPRGVEQVHRSSEPAIEVGIGEEPTTAGGHGLPADVPGFGDATFEGVEQRLRFALTPAPDVALDEWALPEGRRRVPLLLAVEERLQQLDGQLEP